MKLKPPTILLDADYFFYRAATASEYEMTYDADTTVIAGSLSLGQKIIRSDVKNLKQRFDTDHLIMTFTDVKNFRKTIDSSYKSNRTKRKPCGFKRLLNWAKTEYECIRMPQLEADDVLGILSTSGCYTNFVLVSPDKDMEQIPCRIYNLKEEFTQTPERAEYKLFEQCLSGDPVDGYSGIKGVGKKKAQLILKNKEGSYWDTVLGAFLEHGYKKADALRQLRLAKILHADDWDFTKEEPILFTP